MKTVPRLFELFKPSHYDVIFNLDNAISRQISGSTVISGVQVGNDIRLHSKELVIDTILVNDVPTSYRQEADTLIIEHETIGDVNVAISYHLTMTDAMHGIYPCYFTVDGVKKELIATQFESHHAREAFPCIDEPEAKATFNVTVTTESGLTVLGNMPVQSQTHDEASNIVSTHFTKSPKMSPYLLAFVVGELQKQSATTNNGTEVNVYATYAQPSDSLAFGLSTAVKSIEFFNDYFDTPYPLPKCDHVALPDFSSGAMENWGLITYREACLLADDNTAISSKQMIATVIAHETSHQWFGNLVTMQWWDDLWLNESFATLMEYVAVDAIYPKWNIWMTFAAQETLSALRRDYLSGVQAVKIDVHHPDEISSLFDPSIVYAKGGRLLKMLHAYIGEDAFRSGLTAYFKTHAYGNTRGSDLWAAFSEATGNDIGAFMDKWLTQPNFPLVTISETTEGYRLSQKPFIIGDSTQKRNWPIPLGITNTVFPQLLESQTADVKASHDTVPLLNKGNSAHFVTDYDVSILGKLRLALNNGTIDAIDRLALLHETSLLARAGQTTAVELWKLTLAYKLENEEPVWDIISLAIADIKRFVEHDEVAEQALKKQIISLVLPLHEELGWSELDEEPESDTKLRATVLGLLTYCDYKPVVDEGLQRFRELDDISTLHGELRSVIYAIAGKCGNATDWNTLFELYKNSQIADLQQDALAGITLTKESALITRLLDSITDETIVRQQDVDRWFAYLIRSRYGRDATWQWMVSHWQWIEEKFDSDKSYDSFPRYAASGLNTIEWKKKFDEFFAPHLSKPALHRAIELGSQDILGRAAWIERDGTDLLAFLKR